MHLEFLAETEVSYRADFRASAESLGTDKEIKTRGTAPITRLILRRLKNLNLGGGASLNRTAETDSISRIGSIAWMTGISQSKLRGREHSPKISYCT